MMGAKNVLDEAPVDVMTRFDIVLGIYEKTLAADETANTGREFRWVALVHGEPAF
jgi:hypothetical protein